jgi:integrase
MLIIVRIQIENYGLFNRYIKLFHNNTPSNIYLFYIHHKNEISPFSQDCVSKFLHKYYNTVKLTHPEIPEKLTPHMLRYSRAMSLYQNGMPLPLISEWLGHSSLETTLVYANADITMKRNAINKATQPLNPLKSKLPNRTVHSTDDILLKRYTGLI